MLDALGFEQLAVLFEPGDAVAEFLADGEDGALHLVAGGDELFAGKMVTASSVQFCFPSTARSG
jgi:hypothetical protein